MAERFKKLFELPGGLYAADAPVLIRAGVLLQDTVTHNVVAQLKLYNLDKRTVRSVKLLLVLWDSKGEQLGEEILRSYTNLRSPTDSEFGQRTALVLPYREARSFSVCVTEVAFTDGTRWTDNGALWEPVARQQRLEDAYGSEEMASQFRIRYGTDCRFAPRTDRLLWQCTCGTVNRENEKSCHRCHRVRKALMGVNEDSLRCECEQRLREERLLTGEREDTPEEPEGKKPRLLRWVAIAVSLLALAAVICFAPRLLNRIVPLPVASAAPTAQPLPTETPVIPTPRPTPVPTPTPTPAPTLSPEKQREADYETASALLDAGSYSAARAAFLKLGDFKDSAELAQEAVYRKAVALYEFIRQHDERDIYAVLSMESDGTNRFSLSTEKALTLGSAVVDELRAACGSDHTDVTMEDAPSEALRPLAVCVKELLSLLGDYKDSAACLSSLQDLTDYTKDFYMLCRAGDIYGACDWLQSYTGEFAGREHWLQLLELYKPFCGSWGLYAGDITLLPLTVGRSYRCTAFTSRVIIDGDYATLRLLIREGESEYNVDLVADTGSTSFLYMVDNAFYSAAINSVDHMAYMKYSNGRMLSSCEYQRAN